MTLPILSMKQSVGRILPTVLVTAALLACAQATPAVDADLASPAKQFLQASQFSIGLVGFAGKISAEETAMRQLARSREAETQFFAVLEDPSATTEGKLYATCGLKLIGSKRFLLASQMLQKGGGAYSTMHGDILKKQDVRIALNHIEESKCK